MPDSVTQILNSGPVGSKQNIAVLGDGFAEADQTAYNNKVRELLLDGVFGHDYFLEDKSAFNIFRVNLISVDSGVSTRVYDEKGTPADGSDDTIVSTTMRNTPLRYIYSGSWAHCWLEGSADTGQRVQQALEKWVPDYDLVVVILNTSGFGGCGGGGFQIVTMGSSWQVMAHEFGHGTGGLADEYCQTRTYTGGEPGAVNLTRNTDRSTLKWRRFVNPNTAVPTGSGNCAGYTAGARPAAWSDSDDAGLFEGGGTWSRGIYRPAINCRMNRNNPPYCPVCYTEMKRRQDAFTGHTFSRCIVGDFNADGKDDVLTHDGTNILVHRSTGSALEVISSATERVAGSWQFQPSDQFFVGDIDGDGADEIVVYNGTAWSMPYLGLLDDDGAGGFRLVARYDGALPGWQMGRNDRWYVGDFDGDGKADLFVFNGTDWASRWFGMFRSQGSSFSLASRFQNDLGGWVMASNDQHYVGDFDGDGRSDLFVFNGTNWDRRWFGMFQSTGTGIRRTALYERNLPGWQMARNDRHFVADFDGDGKDDIYVFNGQDWSISYLGMMASVGNALKAVQVYNGSVPGWQMRGGDLHYAADATGDGKVDLVVYNATSWSTEYLGTMRSDGTSLSCSWKSDWVGEWNLGQVDQIKVCNYQGGAGKPNILIHNRDWLGMMRSAPSPTLQRIYYRWVHNYRHGRNW